jgi:hypothetical protein
VNKAINPNIFFTIIFFIILRFIDAPLFFKGIIFILTSVSLIYLPQKPLNKINLGLLIGLIITFTFFNEKKDIIEKNGPLKINYENEKQYIDILGPDKFYFIKKYFINDLPNCYQDTVSCFQFEGMEENYISPDQIIFNTDHSFSRKIAEINFSNLTDSRMSFINSSLGNVNRHNLYKLETPFFVEYQNLKHLDNICFKGIAFVDPLDSNSFGVHHQKYKCLDNKIKSLTGFNLPKYNLQILSFEKSLLKYFDDLILILFLLLISLNLDRINITLQDLKLFIPVSISIFIIFFISRYDNWFNVFNLFNFYFFGFEGGDGQYYVNLTNILYNSFSNFNILDFLRGGEDTFYYTPGLRYFMFVNQLISGDFYYFYFFLLFFLPKIFNTFLKKQFGEKAGYYLTLSFLILPFLHHIGFSYYQFIRHAYRLFPEPMGYMFFISGLTIFFHSFEKNYLKMNLLFAISVFLRPNLIVSIFFIILIKTIQKRINIFHYKYFIALSLISIIYLFPLFHNLYFGDSFVLFTEYGSNMLSFVNISNNDFEFYINKYKLLNLSFLILLFIPRLNMYLKIILITQYLTIFWFETLGRYYWIYWLVSLNLVYDLVYSLYKSKWKFQKKFISN